MSLTNQTTVLINSIRNESDISIDNAALLNNAPVGRAGVVSLLSSASLPPSPACWHEGGDYRASKGRVGPSAPERRSRRNADEVSYTANCLRLGNEVLGLEECPNFPEQGHTECLRRPPLR